MNDTKNIPEPLDENDVPSLSILEKLFFAYRDFVSDPDKMLDKFGFGRAHHRVLYFVNRSPGLTVAELLETLQITKQSLARVLKQLIDQGYITQVEGASDRRKRLLFPTPEGRNLILELSAPQSIRIKNAISGMSEEETTAIIEFLNRMSNTSRK